MNLLFYSQWSLMLNPILWLDAATQIFFSMSVGMGGVTSFSSYNPKKQNVQRDVIIISVVNSMTSLFASAVIFSINGFRAHIKYESCLQELVGFLNNAQRFYL